MTAQIGIINKNVAVVASDTAASVSIGNKFKIFKTGTKIHNISDDFPVAIMIYSSPNFVNIPWERIIDLYKKEVTEEKGTLIEYLDSFTQFVENHPLLTSYDQNLTFISYFLKREFNFLITDYQSQKERISDFSTWIKEKIQRLRDDRKLIVDPDKAGTIKSIVQSYLENISSYAFVDYPIFLQENIVQITEYLTECFMRSQTPNYQSGIVFAGFGKDDIFPSMIWISINGLFENNIRCLGPRIYDVGISHADINKTSASLIPFAQSDGADMFMDGIAADVQKHFFTMVRNKDNKIREFIKNHTLLEKLAKEDAERLIKDIVSYSSRQEQLFESDLRSYKIKKYSNPIMESIKFMSTEDLVELARTLVSFTSIRRKYSIDQDETVGGDTEVVVLSKDKGFIRYKNK